MRSVSEIISCETIFWDLFSRPFVWDHFLRPCCEISFWDGFLRPFSGTILWNSFRETIVWDHSRYHFRNKSSWDHCFKPFRDTVFVRPFCGDDRSETKKVAKYKRDDADQGTNIAWAKMATDHIGIWSYDHLIIWSYVYVVIWSYDHMLIWSYDHMTMWYERNIKTNDQKIIWWYAYMITLEHNVEWCVENSQHSIQVTCVYKSR